MSLSLSNNNDSLFNGKNVYLYTIQTNLIKTLHECLGQIVTEAEWIFDENGMKTMGMDPSETMFIYVNLSAEGFNNGGSYYCKKDNTFRIGFLINNISTLLKIMKDKNQLFHMYSETDKPGELHLVIENSIVNSKRDWTTSTIDCKINSSLENFYQKINKQYDVVVGIPAVYFQHEIKYLEKICKYVDITVLSDKTITFTTVDNKMLNTVGKNTLSVDKEHGNGIKFYHTTKGKSIIKGRYNLSCLATFVKCTSLSSTSHVKLHMSMNDPLIVEYTIGDLGEIKFCLSEIKN